MKAILKLLRKFSQKLWAKSHYDLAKELDEIIEKIEDLEEEE